MKRQAVVVIHGIGEQKPMSTLRGFVDSISDYQKEKEKIQVFNIPDTFSGSYELRQLALYLGDDLRTDFYEYYWAYHMRDTKLASIGTWLIQLMLRLPKNIPGRIKGIYFLLWFVAITYVVLIVTGGLSFFDKLDWGNVSWIAFALNAALNILAFVLTYFLGDAARYTYASPENIKERSKIRKGGIDLLDKLHASGKYSRIIVVGHSLGSMIGYDMLKHYWAQTYKTYQVSEHYPYQQMKTFNEGSRVNFGFPDSPGQTVKHDAYMKLQANVLDELHSRKNPWLISDFITLGSPLAHGELLMAESKKTFSERKAERELPTSPPTCEKDGGVTYWQPFAKDPDSAYRNIKMEIIHHAGHFAFTRWHNLYYKHDYVGGPVAHVFGNGVKDVPVSSPSFCDNVPFAMHTRYWGEPEKSKADIQESINYLKKIILGI